MIRPNFKKPGLVVVKIGSSTLTTDDGALDVEYFSSVARQVSQIRDEGIKTIIVTSGAIRAGAVRLALANPPTTIPEKQAVAAVGQGLLMRTWSDAFSDYKLAAAQVLLTQSDFQDRRRYINARNTLGKLLEFGAVPIINENDTVAIEEIRVGDNDTLSALVAAAIDSDLLVLLSDVQGFYDAEGKVISDIFEIGQDLFSLAAGAGKFGTGGMRTKLEAAKIASNCGTVTVIAHGREPDAILRIVSGEHIGTWFYPKDTSLCSRKRWIAFGRRPKGVIIVNQGAREMLVSQGKSLLPAGIISTTGNYANGDLVAVADETGERFARGFVNYSSKEVVKILGKKTSEIEQILGYKDFDEVIHRDNMVLGV